MGLFDFGQLFGRKVKNPEDAANAAEEANISVEQRMARVSDRLKKGGYAKLADDELREIKSDIEKIIEFVDHAVAIIQARTEIDPAGDLARRLRYVKTRVSNILENRKDLPSKAGVA